MRKAVTFISLVLAILFTCAFSITGWKNALYEQIKSETIKGLKANFSGDISIGRAEGPLLGQAVFYTVQLPGFVKADKVIVNYNLVKFAFARDIVPSISSITIVDADFKIIRTSAGKWNIFSLLLPPDPKAPPPVFRAKLLLQNCSAIYADGVFNRVVEKISGEISFRQKDRITYKLTGIDDKTVNIKLHGFTNLANGAAQISGKVAVGERLVYGQKVSGEIDFSWADSKLLLDFDQLSLYQGRAAGRCQIAFRPKKIALDLKAKVSNIDLALLSQNTPGITGFASGSLSLSGPITDLTGSLSTRLSAAALFGQPITQLHANFMVRSGDVQINKFRASAPNALVSATGKISRDLFFDLQTQARGIRLSGHGLLGKMEAMVDRFTGSLRFKLDDNFLSAPLKNLTASGQFQISAGQIGQQMMSSAQGSINLGYGLIRIDNAVLKENDSALFISGQTGVGVPTRLLISGEKISLADLKILNHFLPREAQDPSGFLNAGVIITGELSKETRLTSFVPLLGLNLSAEAWLYDARVADIPVLAGVLHLKWEDQILTLSGSQLNFPNHDYLAANLVITDNQELDGKIYGIFEASFFNRFIKKFGVLSGKLGVNSVIGGTVAGPEMAASFWAQSLNYNSIFLDQVEGKVILSAGLLRSSQPIIFSRDNNRYELSGTVDLNPLFDSRPEKIGLNLRLNIPQADFYETAVMAEELQFNLTLGLRLSSPAKKQRINLSTLSVPNAQQFSQDGKLKLYAKNGEKRSFLPSWEKSVADIKKMKAVRLHERVGGVLSGNVILSGEVNSLSGKLEAAVKNGFFRDFSFAELKIETSLGNQTVFIDKFAVEKQGGKIKATGSIGFNGGLRLGITAQEMPLDIASLFFKKDFQGRFAMNASVEGSIENPSFALSAIANHASFAGIYCDKASLSLQKNNQQLVIDNLAILQGSDRSTLQGAIDLSSAGTIELAVNLKNDAVGLFNLFTDDVHWNKGKALAKLKVNGTLAKADIDGSIVLQDGSIYVKALDSEIKKLDSKVAINNSSAKIQSFNGTWQGKTSGNGANLLGITGSIELSRLLSANNLAEFNLSFAPANLYVSLPNLYRGLVQVLEARLVGPLYFNYSSGPTLSGKARLSEANIILPAPSGTKSAEEKPFPLNLDLSVGLDKNVNVSLGEANFNFSYLLMNLEINSDELKLGGSLAHPSLVGKINLKRGTVNIFSREFSLLSLDEQKRFYPYDQEKLKDNLALFSGENGQEGILPQVEIMARTEVENSEKNASGQTEKKKVIILSRISGKMGSAGKERGLTLAFSSFTEDKTKSPIEMIPANYSEQGIKVMLLPDFIKSLTGLSGDNSSVNTNVVIADYLASRLQAVVFQGVERGLAQALGLESLTLEYNFGRNLRQSLGITEVSLLQEEKPDWRVGAAKGFFDRLYIDVLYAQYSQTMLKTGLYNSLNYQLTYKISPIWSIIYYREPISWQELTTGYQKMTLKAVLSLW